MQVERWIALFRRVPSAQHDNLVVVTSSTEIMVQKIVRLEDDFVLLRGRLSGSTDQNRVMMIPYDQLTYIAFNKPLLEKEIHAIFGAATNDTEFAQVAQVVAEQAASKEAPVDEIEEDEDDVEVDEPVKDPAAKPKPPSKSILLARLRERLAGGDRSG